MKNLFVEKSKEQTSTLEHKIKANQVILQSEITSSFQYLATSIEGSRKELNAALIHNINLGNKRTASLIRASWSGLRNNINTIGIGNERLYQYFLSLIIR